MSLQYRITKRAMDIVLSALVLPAVVPLIALCAVIVRLDSRGSPFFVQTRTGLNGRRFKMIKLRTMVQDAEALKQTLIDQNERTGPDFKVDNDPRITAVGRFLRKTSLDELPQILNVLAGSMSLVGPRPTSFGAETYSLWHAKRLEAKPGLTGAWQVHGRSIEDFDDRVRLELTYLHNPSVRADLVLIAKTIPAMLGGAGH